MRVPMSLPATAGAVGRRQPTGKQRGLRHSRGVTLIEVLVTILIIGIGLLGLAGMQTVSMQYNHSSYLRTTANNLAYDIADRMRSNRSEAVDGERYNIDFGTLSSNLGGVAGDDLNEWFDALNTSLPDGEARIRVRSDGRAIIEIRWLDGRDAREEDDTTTFTLRTRL